MIQNDRKSRKIRQLNWIKELAHVLDTMTSSLITYGIEMIEDPCNTCLVTACCTELCDKIADFWTHIYTEYKKSPNETVMKYGLNDMRAKTLKDLHEAAIIRNPCLKCIVRARCSELCIEKNKYTKLRNDLKDILKNIRENIRYWPTLGEFAVVILSFIFEGVIVLIGGCAFILVILILLSRLNII